MLYRQFVAHGFMPSQSQPKIETMLIYQLKPHCKTKAACLRIQISLQYAAAPLFLFNFFFLPTSSSLVLILIIEKKKTKRYYIPCAWIPLCSLNVCHLNNY